MLMSSYRSSICDWALAEPGVNTRKSPMGLIGRLTVVNWGLATFLDVAVTTSNGSTSTVGD